MSNLEIAMSLIVCLGIIFVYAITMFFKYLAKRDTPKSTTHYEQISYHDATKKLRDHGYYHVDTMPDHISFWKKSETEHAILYGAPPWITGYAEYTYVTKYYTKYQNS